MPARPSPLLFCASLIVSMLAACDAAPEPAKPPPEVRVETSPSVEESPPPAQPPTEDTSKVTPPVEPVTADDRTRDEANTIDVFRAAAPATVFVTQKQLIQDRWSRRALEVPAGSGSGFIWDGQGHIVTNAHVVSGARSLEVTLYDKSTHPAKLVGVDPNHDIAVIKIEPGDDELVAVRVPPTGQELVVGQKALAIGNPFGLDHTLTVGVISALGREVKGFGKVTIRGMIQTDASINPGNSGGPLLNSAGELIGMNTLIFSKSGSSAGIGFAVPIRSIARLVPQLIKHGKPQRAGFGFVVVPDEVAQQNGIVGVVIGEVSPGSAAAKAGLQGLRRTAEGPVLGDVIVAIDEEKIETYDDLYNALDGRDAGEVVTVKVQRDGAVSELRIELMSL